MSHDFLDDLLISERHVLGSVFHEPLKHRIRGLHLYEVEPLEHFKEGFLLRLVDFQDERIRYSHDEIGLDKDTLYFANVVVGAKVSVLARQGESRKCFGRLIADAAGGVVFERQGFAQVVDNFDFEFDGACYALFFGRGEDALWPALSACGSRFPPETSCVVSLLLQKNGFLCNFVSK
jgi:hypothetical protein